MVVCVGLLLCVVCVVCVVCCMLCCFVLLFVVVFRFAGEDGPLSTSDVTPFSAFCIEVATCLVLCFVIFLVTHPKNKILGKDSRPMVPYFIGFTVAGLISLYAPLTQA
uniref:Uncharacterized protein n=1 Tax=Lotharella globosa TaxID=91324 RepID=A0A7S3YP28_9EUKA